MFTQDLLQYFYPQLTCKETLYLFLAISFVFFSFLQCNNELDSFSYSPCHSAFLTSVICFTHEQNKIYFCLALVNWDLFWDCELIFELLSTKLFPRIFPSSSSHFWQRKDRDSPFTQILKCQSKGQPYSYQFYTPQGPQTWPPQRPWEPWATPAQHPGNWPNCRHQKTQPLTKPPALQASHSSPLYSEPPCLGWCAFIWGWAPRRCRADLALCGKSIRCSGCCPWILS